MGAQTTLTMMITTTEIETIIYEKSSFDLLYFGIGAGFGVTVLLIAMLALLRRCKSLNDENNDKRKDDISKQIEMNTVKQTKVRVSTASMASSYNINSSDFEVNLDDMAIAMSVDLPSNHRLEIAEKKQNNLKVDDEESTDEGLWDR